MPAKTVEVVLTGTNAKAIQSINQVGTAADKTAKKTTDTFEKGTSKIGSSFSKLGSLGASFGLPLSNVLGTVGQKFEDSAKHTDSFGKKLTHIGDTVAVGAAAGLALVGSAAIKAALDGEASQARVETAIKNTGQSYDQYADKIDSTADHMADFGIENDQVNDAIAALIPVTHDTQKAIDLMGLAADIAAARHINLGDATKILVAVENGRYAALVKQGIITKEQSKNIHSTEQAVKLLSNTYQGSAAAAADTYSGKIAAVSAKIANLEEELGNKLLPVVTNVATAVIDSVDAFDSFNESLGGTPGKVAAVAGELAVITYAATKLNGVLTAIPLVGPALAPIAPAVGAIAAAFAVGHVAVDLFVKDTSDGIKTTEHFARGLEHFAASGADAYVSGRLGPALEKLTKSFKDADEIQHGFGGTVLDVGVKVADLASHLLGGKSALEETLQPIENTQKALISLFKTDPGAAIVAFEQLKAGLEANGVSAEKVDDRFKKFEKTMQDSGIVIGSVQKAELEYGAILDAGGAKTEKAAEARQRLFDAAKHQAGITKEISQVESEAANATDDATGAIDAQKLSVSDLVTKLEESKVGFENENAALKTFADNQTDADQATQALTQHLKDLNDTVLAAANQEIALQQANLRVGDSEKNLSDAIKEHGAKSKEAQAAQLDLNSSVLSAVGAAESNAEAIDKEKIAHGENISQVQIENDKHAAAYGELEGLKRQYPALSGLIGEYERKLGLIPPTKSTIVTAHVQYDIPPLKIYVPNVPIGEISYRTPQGELVGVPVYQHARARGGPVTADTPFLVGEEGPELFVPKKSGMIVSNDRLVAYGYGAVPSAARDAASPTVHITLRNETHVDPISGRAIHRLVQEDQSRNGPWKIRIRA